MSTRCVGVEIDSQLKWNIHVKELIRSFTQKPNLLRSLYFLPTKARADFYFKIILPSVTYGLVIWGSCGKTLLSELEHVRAAKLIYGMDTPSEEVLARAGWTTIGHMYSQKMLLLAYKGYYSLLPIPLQPLFTKCNFKYNLRKKFTLQLARPKTDFLKKSISYNAALRWNSLDNKTRGITNFNCFRSKVKQI